VESEHVGGAAEWALLFGSLEEEGQKGVDGGVVVGFKAETYCISAKSFGIEMAARVGFVTNRRQLEIVGVYGNLYLVNTVGDAHFGTVSVPTDKDISGEVCWHRVFWVRN
jgi:hypothetical protein